MPCADDDLSLKPQLPAGFIAAVQLMGAAVRGGWHNGRPVVLAAAVEAALSVLYACLTQPLDEGHPSASATLRLCADMVGAAPAPPAPGLQATSPARI